ncbi:MAG: FAD-dependent oxidoreductase [Propionicimonas sp.]|nr:FAD-dependent oxidoreductase [Propionicimonas sp.]
MGTDQSHRPVRVVVLGGGYSGLWAARRIARRLGGRLRSGQVLLTLVSAMDHHAFHGWTAEVITGDVRPEHARVPIDRLLPAEVTRLYGEATAVDLGDRTATVQTTAGTRVVRYDHLVVAVGSRDARDRIDGLRAHGWSVKDDGHLQALNVHLGEVAQAATGSDPAERDRLLTAVVAGGGLAGTEMAAAILQRLRDEVAARPALAAAVAPGLPRVVLVHSHDRLVSDMPPRVGDYAARLVCEAGIEVRYDHRLAAVTADGATLDDGGLVRSATVLSALGQDVVRLPGTEHLDHDERGRLVTDAFLQTAAPGLWAGGDVAAVPRADGSGPCRSDALWAISHGKHLGDNVARAVTGRDLVPFGFRGLGRAASLGVGRGAGELYGYPLVGWPSWLMRWVLFHWFMPSRRVALASAAGWLRRTPWPSRRVSRQGAAAS